MSGPRARVFHDDAVVSATEGRPRIGLVASCSGCAESVGWGLGWRWDGGEVWVVKTWLWGCVQWGFLRRWIFWGEIFYELCVLLKKDKEMCK